MTYLNKNFNPGVSPWATFCVFSITESGKSEFLSITSSVFFSSKFNLAVNDELVCKLHDTNFKVIFDIDNSYPETIIEKFGEEDSTIIVFKGTLEALLSHEEFFKDNINKKYISNSLFIFHTIPWKEICKQFLIRNIVISGGSSTRRHIISPVHVKLMVALNTFNFSYQDVVSSFNKISRYKEISMPKDELIFNSALMKQGNKKPSTIINKSSSCLQDAILSGSVKEEINTTKISSNNGVTPTGNFLNLNPNKIQNKNYSTLASFIENDKEVKKHPIKWGGVCPDILNIRPSLIIKG